jgi:hypothetical protein
MVGTGVFRNLIMGGRRREGCDHFQGAEGDRIYVFGGFGGFGGLAIAAELPPSEFPLGFF